MPTPQDVKDASYTGEFALLADGVIQGALDEAAEHYKTLPQRVVRASVVSRLIVLHAAHRLHMGILQESGEENGGGQGQSGPVKSASLDRVGSWTFGSSSSNLNANGNKDPLPDWDDSPYGRRWKGLWQGITPPLATTSRAVGY